jgi:hypothetical protein
MHPEIQAKKMQHLGRFFHQIKKASQRKKGFYTNRASFKKFKINIKKIKNQ